MKRAVVGCWLLAVSVCCKMADGAVRADGRGLGRRRASESVDRVRPRHRLRRAPGVMDETLAAALEQWRFAENLFDPSGAPEWVKDDFLMLDLLYRAVEMRIKTPDKANFRASFEPEYRRLWLRQNRVGGLDLSLVTVFGR